MNLTIPTCRTFVWKQLILIKINDVICPICKCTHERITAYAVLAIYLTYLSCDWYVTIQQENILEAICAVDCMTSEQVRSLA